MTGTEQEQLLRAQRLLLRELGLGLTAIAEVLDGQRDQVAALRSHEQWLHQERDRLTRLADTVPPPSTNCKEERR